MKVEQIIDYASPCMSAEKSLKEVHSQMLDGNFDRATAAALNAAGHIQWMLFTIHKMKEEHDSHSPEQYTYAFP
ncbi:hypothetical protein UFOVP1049_60 [uncultured Caudovirales phage]|uniref:Uncharacterized protein n=1 Tax=uncultured Caudovirales phage TaxID=2100421 RepID=A0A6J5Q8I5_9CAUD|nr:hypothetical protein UFOVP1049_60 [uncultured Caudovirales phage]